MGSAGFLLIFTAVNAANALHAKRTKSRLWISGAGVLACMGALVALLWQTLAVSPEQVWVLVGMVGAAATIEGGYRGLKKRTIRLPHL
jgi:protein-S-isoprenylcysteine O-methyltransferase Ste14